jgi:hypothetical protein
VLGILVHLEVEGLHLLVLLVEDFVAEFEAGDLGVELGEVGVEEGGLLLEF